MGGQVSLAFLILVVVYLLIGFEVRVLERRVGVGSEGASSESIGSVGVSRDGVGSEGTVGSVGVSSEAVGRKGDVGIGGVYVSREG